MLKILGMQFEESNDEWISPDGKIIPFTRFEYELREFQNEFCSLSISVTKWPAKTSLEIIEITGDVEPDTDPRDRYLDRCTYRICKLPHEEFKARQEELVLKAKKFAHKIYVSNTGNDFELNYFE